MDVRVLCSMDVLIYVFLTFPHKTLQLDIKSYFGTSIEHNIRTSIGRRVLAGCGFGALCPANIWDITVVLQLVEELLIVSYLGTT